MIESTRAFMNETSVLNWPRLRAELKVFFDFKITAFDVFKQLGDKKKLSDDTRKILLLLTLFILMSLVRY